MRSARILVLLFLVAVAAGVGTVWWKSRTSHVEGSTIAVYYARADGTTLAPWRVSLGPARDLKSVAFYAAVQCAAGPPAGTDAIRFPPGTRVRAVDVSGSTADVDLSHEIDGAAGGSFTEAAIFKALTWTMTGLPGITQVALRVDGTRLATLPGGHLELDAPLSRSSF